MNLVSRLKHDHDHINDLLDLLEKQINIVEQQPGQARHLMYDVMKYMSNYPIGVHDHLEDLMFHKLLSLSGALRELLDDLLEQHAELELAAARLYQHLERNQSLDTERLVKLARSYLRLQRQHMKIEEEQVFPLAKELLSKQDYAEIIAEHESQESSATMDVLGARYDSLRRHLASATRH